MFLMLRAWIKSSRPLLLLLLLLRARVSSIEEGRTDVGRVDVMSVLLVPSC